MSENKVLIPALLILTAAFLASYSVYNPNFSITGLAHLTWPVDEGGTPGPGLPEGLAWEIHDPIIVNRSDCPGSNRVFTMSSNANAHAALWNETLYEYAVCVINTNSSQGRMCTGGNEVIKLSSNINAHAEQND